MKLENNCIVPAGLDETWDYLMDVATAAGAFRAWLTLPLTGMAVTAVR